MTLLLSVSESIHPQRGDTNKWYLKCIQIAPPFIAGSINPAGHLTVPHPFIEAHRVRNDTNLITFPFWKGEQLANTPSTTRPVCRTAAHQLDSARSLFSAHLHASAFKLKARSHGKGRDKSESQMTYGEGGEKYCL